MAWGDGMMQIRRLYGSSNKRGVGVVMSFVLQGIMVAAVFVMLILAVNERSSSRDIRGQVLEKQLALLIDAADKGFVFIVSKHNINGWWIVFMLREGRFMLMLMGCPVVVMSIFRVMMFLSRSRKIGF